MGIEQPGLEKRMGREARRISSQHQQLDALFGLVEGALERGDAREAEASLTRFGDALEAHFSLEDSLYFPALHGMRPEFGAELDALSREHVELLRELEAVQRRLRDGVSGDCAANLDAFAERIARHESVEEELITRIRGEGAAPR